MVSGSPTSARIKKGASLYPERKNNDKFQFQNKFYDTFN